MKTFTFLLLLLMLETVATAQWKADSLTTPRAAIPIAILNSKVVMGSSSGSAWDVYDLKTNAHTSGVFSFARSDIKFTKGGKNAYFAGGKYGPYTDPLFVKNVDVYNSTSNTWSALNLSLARIVGGAGSVGNKVFFAGGTGRDFGGPMYIYNRVDIFDVNTGIRTTAKLSKARVNIAAGSAANKIAFAGGWFWDVNYVQIESNVVDIYDNNTGIWSKALLSQKREGIGVAVVGNKILFAGGYTINGIASNNVDIYDAAANTWTTTYLSTRRSDMAIAVSGTKAFFAGGGGAVNSIDVYDVAANTWSQLTMPVALSGYSACAIGDKIYYAGGYDVNSGSFSNLVQIYNVTTNTWSMDHLSQPRSAISAASSGNKAVFAGGAKAPFNPITYSNRVDFYNQQPFASNLKSSIELTEQKANILISPNPATNFIVIKGTGLSKGKNLVTILDNSGRVFMQQSVNGSDIDLRLSVQTLTPGIYTCNIQAGENVHSVKFIKN